MSIWANLRELLGYDPPTPVVHHLPDVSVELQRQYGNFEVLRFIRARVSEIEDVDPDGAQACRQVIDDCCDHVDITPGGYTPGSRYLLGAPNDMRSLLKLARNWADHPDFRPQWWEK